MRDKSSRAAAARRAHNKTKRVWRLNEATGFYEVKTVKVKALPLPVPIKTK